MEAIREALTPQTLAGRRVLVTAGPTREAMDPVRHLTNPSTGKMGYALARAAKRRGAEVILVSGPTSLESPRGVNLVRAESARRMYEAVLDPFPSVDAVVMAAAVSDYRPKAQAPQKLKKEQTVESVALERTEDILRRLGEIKGGQILVGFAAETENLVEHARAKLREKNLDFIVANDLTAAHAGFGSDTNQVTILWPDGRIESLPLQDKELVAEEVWDRVESLWRH
jgi:phosphopantothenoylcysteine decarboxylase/phosphopantothenate--cysteine ligase